MENLVSVLSKHKGHNVLMGLDFPNNFMVWDD